MNTIEVDKYRFLEVSTNPNIIISLKGEINFCELSHKDNLYLDASSTTPPLEMVIKGMLKHPYIIYGLIMHMLEIIIHITIMVFKPWLDFRVSYI